MLYFFSVYIFKKGSTYQIQGKIIAKIEPY